MIGLLRLFFSFFKIGLFSFGGGYAMLPLIYQEVEGYGMSMKEFSDVVAISQMTPGPIAVNTATYVGYRVSGFWGSAFATFGVSLPSFILIMLISAAFDKFKTNRTVEAALEGIRPATVGMIASAVVFFANTSLVDLSLIGEGFWKIFSLPAIAIFAVTLLGSKYLKIGPIVLTLLGGVLGILLL